MGCAMGTVRYILFFFNFLLALAGLGILILGILTAQTTGATLNDIVHGQLTIPAITFSVVGACVFIFAFLGCWGALRESQCMISTYAVLLLTLFLLQVAVAVLAYTYKSETKDLITKNLRERFEKYNTENKTKEFIDTLQQQFQCCGSEDTKTPWTSLGIPTPPSCYPGNNTASNKFDTGCIPHLSEMVENGLSNITQVAIVVAIVQVVGIVFALCLANSIRRQEMRGYA